MPIKNYTTKVPAVQTVGEIQGILASHGARKIMMDYDATGQVMSVSFSIETPYGIRGFILPANVEAVAATLTRQRVKCDADTAERVAWRIVKDWIDAQMAFLESQQVTMDQVFLPYMANTQGQTVYELLVNQQLMLGDGN